MNCHQDVPTGPVVVDRSLRVNAVEGEDDQVPDMEVCISLHKFTPAK